MTDQFLIGDHRNFVYLITSNGESMVINPQNNLTPWQKRIAELVAQAYPNREIARKLQIKEQSVRNELSRIFKKMGVWNRVELALLMRNDPAGAAAANGSKPWTQVKPAGTDTRMTM